MNLTWQRAQQGIAAVAAIATYVLLLVSTELEPLVVLLVGSITYLVSLAVVVRTTVATHVDIPPGGGFVVGRARG